jgi:hypothetical protein
MEDWERMDLELSSKMMQSQPDLFPGVATIGGVPVGTVAEQGLSYPNIPGMPGAGIATGSPEQQIEINKIIASGGVPAPIPGISGGGVNLAEPSFLQKLASGYTVNIGGVEVPWSTIVTSLAAAGTAYAVGNYTGGQAAGQDINTVLASGGGRMATGGGVKMWQSMGATLAYDPSSRRFFCKKVDGTVKSWRIPKNIVISGNPRLKDLRRLAKAQAKAEKAVRPFVRARVVKVPKNAVVVRA